MTNALLFVLVAVISYLIGSVCVGVILSVQFWKKDVRNYGSKSAGATNVLRNMGFLFGLLTFLGDLLKVAIACWIGMAIIGRTGGMVAGIFAVLGHNWPIYYKFKGGKGVAGSLGAMLVMFPLPAVFSMLAAIGIIAITKFVSVGSMTLLSVFAIILTVQYWGQWGIVLWAWFLAGLCIYRHKANIQRLKIGSENKLSFKSKS